MQRVSVPVSVPNPSNNILEASGSLIAEAEALVLDLQVKNGLLFWMKPQPCTVRIPYDDVAEVALHASLFASQLLVRVHSLMALGEMPFATGAVLRLNIQKGDRPLAEELAATVVLRLSESRVHRELDSGA